MRVTGNHKFNLTTGGYKTALELQAGDSIASLTRFHATFDEALPALNKTKSQNYMWVTTGKGQPTGEHRLIAAFYAGRKLNSGEVVHHRDFDALNNLPSNLEVMSVEAHDRLHGDAMRGDNNPMRERWWGQISDQEKETYRQKMSVSTTGERNGKFSGSTHQDISSAAKALVQVLGRGFTRPEWHAYAKAKGLPQSLSKFRKTEFGNIQDLSARVATELALPIAPRGVGNSRHFARNFALYQLALESGFVSVRHEGDFYPIITKACEDCGTLLKCLGIGARFVIATLAA